MNWPNLKSNLCPKDRGALHYSALDQMHYCTKSPCDFKINAERFDELVTNLYRPVSKRAPVEEDNLSALNNFGHTVRSEDYSDSI